MSSSYYHNDLSDKTSWDDLKVIFNLRQPTIDKLKQSDPRSDDVPEGEKHPLWHNWMHAGIVRHDALQLWEHLHEQPASTSDNGDPPVDSSEAPSRSRAGAAANRDKSDV